MVKLTNFGHLTTEIPQFWPWSWSKKTNFDHLTTAISKFWPWSRSKIFDHLTMTPERRPNGQKFMVILPPPPPSLGVDCSKTVFTQLPLNPARYKSTYQKVVRPATNDPRCPARAHCFVSLIQYHLSTGVL